MLLGSPCSRCPGGAAWVRQPPVHLGLAAHLEDTGACLRGLLAGRTAGWKVPAAGPLQGEPRECWSSDPVWSALVFAAATPRLTWSRHTGWHGSVQYTFGWRIKGRR